MKGTYLLVTCLLIAGCAADRNARELSRVTLSQVVSYEDSVRQLSRQLNDHYKTTSGHLAENLKREGENDIIRAQKTDAESAAIVALDKGQLEPPAIRDFLVDSMRKRKDREVGLDTRIATMKASHKMAMADLQVKEDRLKGVRGKLERLQAEPGFTNYLNRLKPLFDAVKDPAKDPTEVASEGDTQQ